MKFVSRVLAGEPLVAVCRDFGISRKTGTKFWKRYQEEGPEGLLNRSRAVRRNNKTICEILHLGGCHPFDSFLSQILENNDPNAKV